MPWGVEDAAPYMRFSGFLVGDGLPDVPTQAPYKSPLNNQLVILTHGVYFLALRGGLSWHAAAFML